MRPCTRKWPSSVRFRTDMAYSRGHNPILTGGAGHGITRNGQYTAAQRPASPRPAITAAARRRGHPRRELDRAAHLDHGPHRAPLGIRRPALAAPRSPGGRRGTVSTPDRRTWLYPALGRRRIRHSAAGKQPGFPDPHGWFTRRLTDRLSATLSGRVAAQFCRHRLHLHHHGPPAHVLDRPAGPIA